MNIVQIKGNTFGFYTGTMHIPFYKINEEEIIMMDTGWKDDGPGLERLLEANNLRVGGIINSHAHRDHVGNNAYFKEKHNSIIAMPYSETLLCSSAANLKFFFTGLALSDVKAQFGHLVCRTDVMIDSEQENINLLGIDFKIIHTPGHSSDHICIVTPDDVAYLGDALLGYELMEEAKVPYAHILNEDLKSKETLHELKCSKYVIAHKGIFEDISRLIDDNISFYKARAAKIYEIIETGMTMEDIMVAIAKKLYIRVDNVNKYIDVERRLKPHIDYLYETGKLRIYEEDGLVKYWKWA